LFGADVVYRKVTRSCDREFIGVQVHGQAVLTAGAHELVIRNSNSKTARMEVLLLSPGIGFQSSARASLAGPEFTIREVYLSLDSSSMV